jgi:Putative beta-barrel porin-2, OmpL-like. bbp2
MKFNKWTLGLAAVGAVSLASVAQAEEKASSVLTTVASTMIDGYVSTSMDWNPGTGNAHVPGYAFNGPGKADGFNLDVFKLSISKALDESEWAAGYGVDLIYGPDANFFGTTPIGGAAATDFAIKQAYVTLRTPIGNGIDWKVGVWDSILGYESFDSPNNPNYTRSYGYTLEPTTHTGVLGTYKVADWLSTSFGIANTTGPVIGGETVNPNGVLGAPQVVIGRSNPPKSESYKTYMGSVSLTAPNDWGFLAGSSFYAGFINGYGGAITPVGDTLNIYAGATINTPVTGLRAGVSYDYFGADEGQNYAQSGLGAGATPGTWANAVSLYASYQATEKLSFNGRAEWFWQSGGTPVQATALTDPTQVFALTATVQYDLWKNVISRLELRWDHQADGTGHAYGGHLSNVGGLNAGAPVGASGVADKRNSYLAALNIVYKF